jgi:hypothetical protein
MVQQERVNSDAHSKVKKERCSGTHGSGSPVGLSRVSSGAYGRHCKSCRGVATSEFKVPSSSDITMPIQPGPACTQAPASTSIITRKSPRHQSSGSNAGALPTDLESDVAADVPVASSIPVGVPSAGIATSFGVDAEDRGAMAEVDQAPSLATSRTASANVENGGMKCQYEGCGIHIKSSNKSGERSH